ncbi:MAG: hypothetical protein WBB55_08855 [Anaerolineales bacterium]
MTASPIRADNFVMIMVTTMTLIVGMMINAVEWGQRKKDEFGKLFDA